MNIQVLESVKIRSTMSLSSDDLSVLALLYQPLITANAFTLYVTLHTLLNKETLEFDGQIKNVLNIINVSLKEFEIAKNKLEAVGLLNTYHGADGYILEINQPLGANEFIMDGSLGVYLFTEIGEDDFMSLSKRFKINNLQKKKYENVTKNFSDVFKSHTSRVDFNGTFKTRVNAMLKFESEFNFDLFASGLSKNFFSPSMLTDKLKDTLVKLAFTYGLDESDMQDAYIRSLNNAGRLDYRVFPKETRKQYQFKTGMDSPKIDIRMNKVNGEGLLNHLRSITPNELLQELSGMPAAPNELQLVYKLISVNKLNPEMVNLLIFFVLKINNGKMPTYSYFAKIANEWGRNGLNDLESAYEYVKGNTKKGNKPDWLKEYRKERVQKDTEIQKHEEERVSKLELDEVSKRFSSL